MISAYAANTTDYSNNGLVILDRYCISAVIAEKLNGEYTLTLELAVDPRTVEIVNEMVIKCPAPVRFTPRLDITAAEPTEIYKVTTSTGQRLNLRTKPSMSTGRVLRAYPVGTEVIVTDKSDGTWYAVAAPDGLNGYMYADNLIYVRTDSSAPVDTGTVEEHATKDQLFRVRSVSSTLDSMTVEAQHISYDLRRNYVKSAATKGKTGAEALGLLLGATIAPHEFTGYSDIAATIEEDVSRKNPIAVLFSDGGFVPTAGGQVLRDNFDIFWTEHIGRDRGVSIAYRKNLAGMDINIDTNDIVTRIIPVGYTKDNKPIYGDAVDSEHIDEYAQPYILEYEYKEVKVGAEGFADEAAVKAELAKRAKAEFDNDIDLPTVSASVDFVDLKNTDIGRDFTAFTGVFLGDTVRIRHEDYRYDIETYINAYEWDVLSNEYISIELGSKQASLSDVRLSPSQIGNSTLTGRKLATGTISGAELGEGSVGSSHIEEEAVENRHMAYGSISVDNLQANSITAEKIKAGAITAEKLAADSVTTEKLAAESITADKIKAGSIETRNLAAAAVTADKIAAGSITADRLKAGTITAESGVLGVAVIGTEQIADSSITAAKIVSLNADAINAGTLSVERLLIVGENGVIHRINATSAGLTATELTKEQYKKYINGTVIVAKSITAAQIAAKTITANEITAGAITSAEINTAELFASQAFVDALVTTDISSNSFLRLMIGDIHVGGTQLLLDTKHLETGTGAGAWRMSATGAGTYSQADTDFMRLRLHSEGATENTWIGASSPVVRLPDGWQGKEMTLSAWVYSADWSAVDQGITWVLALNDDGSATRKRWSSKYNMVKRGAAALGADGGSDVPLRNYRWTRVWTTFTLEVGNFDGGTQADEDFTGNTHMYAQFFLARNGDVRFYAPKLELGNKATDWTPAPEDPVEKLATSYIDIGEDHIEMRSGGRFDVTADRYRFSLTEGDDDSIVMDIDETDGYTSFRGVRAGNLREAEYSEVAYDKGGGVAGLAKFLARTDARRVTYTAASDEGGAVTLDRYNGYLYINGGGHRLPRLALGRGFTGTVMLVDCLLSQDKAEYALIVSGGTAVVYNSWFYPGTTLGLLAEYGGSVRWFNNKANDSLTPMTLSTRLFYARYCGEITYTGKIPGGGIVGTSGFIRESAGTATTVVSGESAPPAETTKTVSLTAALGTYGTSSGWMTTGCFQGYSNGKGRIYGCLKFDASAVTGTVKSARLTLHRKSGVGLNRDAAVTVYTTATAWGSAPASLTKRGESAGLMAWDESGTLDINVTGAANIVSGSAKQLVLYTGETGPISGKVYSQHYAQFDSAVLEITYTV